MKKILAFLLAAAMIFAVAAPAAFASESELPVVYIEGQGMPLANADGAQIYPLTADFMSIIKDEILPEWEQVVKGVATGDYSDCSDTICESLIPVFADVKIDKNGEAGNGSGLYPNAKWTGNPGSIKTSIPTTNGGYPVYRWHYDWRLSPLELADELDEVIDAVLAETGAPKVHLVSRCLGSNIAYAYLYTYETDKVSSAVFYIPAIEGLGLITALFSGEIKLNAGAVDRFISYYSDSANLVIKDDETTNMIMALVELLKETKVLGVGLDALQKIVDNVSKDALPRILKESYGTFPAYWSMVGSDKYEKARDFVFGKNPDPEWAELIEKTDAYYEIQKNSTEFMKSLGNEIDVAVISKYGFPGFPLSADAAEEADVYVSAKLSSMGATVTDLDKKFSSSYINKAKENGTYKYISADKKIDASTCALPDTTWFIKDLDHKAFPDCVNDLIVAFIQSNGTMTVESDPNYTQYLQFNATNGETSDGSRGTLSPIVTMDDTHDTTDKYAKGPLAALLRFINKLVSFLRTIFTGKAAV